MVADVVDAGKADEAVDRQEAAGLCAAEQREHADVRALVERYDAVKFGIFQRNLSNFRGLVLFFTSYGARPQARAVNLSLKSKS